MDIAIDTTRALHGGGVTDPHRPLPLLDAHIVCSELPRSSMLRRTSGSPSRQGVPIGHCRAEKEERLQRPRNRSVSGTRTYTDVSVSGGHVSVGLLDIRDIAPSGESDPRSR